MMRVLLDTDVNLDFILARQPFFNQAEEIFIAIAQNKFEAFIASVTAINIYYIGRKAKGSVLTLQELEKLLSLVKICPISSNNLQTALVSPITDYEDAVQHECAVSEGLDAIVTRNTNDFKYATVKVYSPKEFLQAL